MKENMSLEFSIRAIGSSWSSFRSAIHFASSLQQCFAIRLFLAGSLGASAIRPKFPRRQSLDKHIVQLLVRSTTRLWLEVPEVGYTENGQTYYRINIGPQD